MALVEVIYNWMGTLHLWPFMSDYVHIVRARLIVPGETTEILNQIEKLNRRVFAWWVREKEKKAQIEDQNVQRLVKLQPGEKCWFVSTMVAYRLKYKHVGLLFLIWESIWHEEI